MQKPIIKIIILSISLIISLFQTVYAAEITFVSLADIHFNPFYACGLSISTCPLANALNHQPALSWPQVFNKYHQANGVAFYQDTNETLFEATLESLHRLSLTTPLTFGLLDGDTLGHHLRPKYIFYTHDYTQVGFQRFIQKLLIYISARLKTSVPNLNIYAVIGNNDTVGEDYSVEWDGFFLHKFSENFSQLIPNDKNRRIFRQENALGGYYKVNLNKETQLIVLNTVWFSSDKTGKRAQKLGLDELAWLKKHLEAARQAHQKVLLAFHIPIGINIYATLQTYFNVTKQFWMPVFNKEFLSLLKQYRDIVPGCFAAHIHREELQFGMNPHSTPVPLYITPSISPIFGNYPAYKVFSLNPDRYGSLKEQKYIYRPNIGSSKYEWR